MARPLSAPDRASSHRSEERVALAQSRPNMRMEPAAVPHTFPKYSVKRGLKRAQDREVESRSVDVFAGQSPGWQSGSQAVRERPRTRGRRFKSCQPDRSGPDLLRRSGPVFMPGRCPSRRRRDVGGDGPVADQHRGYAALLERRPAAGGSAGRAAQGLAPVLRISRASLALNGARFISNRRRPETPAVHYISGHRCPPAPIGGGKTHLRKRPGRGELAWVTRARWRPVTRPPTGD